MSIKNRYVFHSIYLLHEREFVKSRENIYKIGRTTQENTKRITQYPIGSRLIYFRTCNDSVFMESAILKSFRSKYTSRTDIGSEYFEGDFNTMIKDISNVLDSVIDIGGGLSGGLSGGLKQDEKQAREVSKPDYDLYKSITDDADHISSKINELLKETKLLSFKSFAKRIDMIKVPDFMFEYFDILNKKEPIYLSNEIVDSFGYKCENKIDNKKNIVKIEYIEP